MDALAFRPDRRTDAHGLSREHFPKGRSIETTHAGVGDATADEREVRNVVVAVERGAARTFDGHLDAVGSVVGLFRIDFHPVRQRQFRKTVFEGLFGDNRTHFGQFFHQIFRQFDIFEGREMLLLGGEHDLLQQIFVGQFRAFLVGTVKHEHLVLVGNQFFRSSIHLVERHFAVEFLRIFQAKFSRDHRLARQEMRHALIHEMAVAAVVALFVATLGGGQPNALGTLEFACRETVLTSLFNGCHSRHQSAENVLLLATDRQRKCLFRAAHEERPSASRSTHKRRIGQLSQVRQAVVEHRTDETVDVVVAQVFFRIFLVVRCRVALHIQMRQDDGLLGVFLDGDNHFLVVRHGIIDPFGRIFRLGNL